MEEKTRKRAMKKKNRLTTTTTTTSTNTTSTTTIITTTTTMTTTKLAQSTELFEYDYYYEYNGTIIGGADGVNILATRNRARSATYRLFRYLKLNLPDNITIF